MRTLAGLTCWQMRATSPNTVGYTPVMDPDVSQAMMISPTASLKCDGRMMPSGSMRLLGGLNRDCSSPSLSS